MSFLEWIKQFINEKSLVANIARICKKEVEDIEETGFPKDGSRQDFVEHFLDLGLDDGGDQETVDALEDAWDRYEEQNGIPISRLKFVTWDLSELKYSNRHRDIILSKVEDLHEIPAYLSSVGINCRIDIDEEKLIANLYLYQSKCETKVVKVKVTEDDVESLNHHIEFYSR